MDTLADVDPKKTRVLWKGLFGKNKSLKSIALESRNRAEKQLPQEETSAFSKSSQKARRARETEESAEALRRQQEAEQEQELQKRVRKYFNLIESGRL